MGRCGLFLLLCVCCWVVGAESSGGEMSRTGSQEGPCVLPSGVNVTFVPGSPRVVLEGMILEISARISPPLPLPACWIDVRVTDTRVMRILQVNTTERNTSHGDNGGGQVEEIFIRIQARNLGKSRVEFVVPNAPKRPGVHPMAPPTDVVAGAYQVLVMRERRLVDTIFHKVAVGMILLINFGFGCEIDMGIIWGHLRRPIAPGIGFLCQFLIMPLVGLTVTQSLGMTSVFGFGLMALACSPGGGASNSWTLLLGGDINLSITMTFLSLIMALGMMPLWMLIVTTIYSNSDIRVPYLVIIQTLAQFVGPCLVGVLLRHALPKVGKIASKALKPVALLFLLWVFTFGIYVNQYMWKLMAYYPSIIIGSLMLPWCGFFFGYSISLVLKQPKKQAITIAIETGIQNIGIPIVILMMNFPQPDGDMAATLASAVGLFTPIPLFAIYFSTMIRDKIRGNIQQRIKVDQQDPDEECGESNLGGQKAINMVQELEEATARKQEKADTDAKVQL